MKMCAPSWKRQLASLLAARKNKNDALRVALVGIGSELRGDDAAGVAVIQRLRPLFAPRDDLQLLDAGPVPESFTGPLRRYAPDLVVLVDAGDFGGQPGEVCLIDWHAAEGFSASTHSLPLSVFAGYLELELNCQVVLLAIQPAQIEFGQGMTGEVEAGVEEVVAGLREVFA
jgi:hydrogenase 3 maturation protease